MVKFPVVYIYAQSYVSILLLYIKVMLLVMAFVNYSYVSVVLYLCYDVKRLRLYIQI